MSCHHIKYDIKSILPYGSRTHTKSPPEVNSGMEEARKLTKNQRKRERRKNRKKGIEKLTIPSLPSVHFPSSGEMSDLAHLSDDEDFKSIMARFTSAHRAEDPGEEEDAGDNPVDEPEIRVSNQQIKKYGRPTIGMLKSVSRRPELIEPFDTDAPDPFTLAEIKNLRNCVPIPGHWSQKRRYLNYKKGSEISRYRLPLYLEKTGIPQMRQVLLEMDEKRSLAQKQRERARPKIGQFDVSVALLRDAFYKQQTKPILSRFGEMYYEGKEMIPNQRNIKPGKISQKLRDALGMVENAPPPWLSRMQKIGPPPSYPNLKIPGLNAPLPKGAQWGTQINGWGQVPVDDTGKPLWGGNPFDPPVEAEEVDTTPLWGTLKRTEGTEDGVNI